MVVEEWKAREQTWWVEDVAQKEVQEAQQDHWAQMEDLEQEHLELQHGDANCQALDTLLGLAATSMPPTAWPLPMAPQGPQVPHTLSQQVPAWAWKEVLGYLLPARPPHPDPTPDLPEDLAVHEAATCWGCHSPWTHVGTSQGWGSGHLPLSSPPSPPPQGPPL